MKSKKKWITKIDKIKVIFICLTVLLITITIVMTTIEKEEQKTEESKVVSTFENDGEFIYNTADEEKTITFTLKNETNDKKNYNLEIKNVINELEDISKLTYDLWINEKQEVSNEIFPNEEMILLEEEAIDAHETLEFKIILKRAEKEIENSKTISGKLTIEDY